MTKTVIKPRTVSDHSYEALNSNGEWIGVNSHKHATEVLGRKPSRGEYRRRQLDAITHYSADNGTVYAHWSHGAVTVWTYETSDDRAIEVARIRNDILAEQAAE